MAELNWGPSLRKLGLPRVEARDIAKDGCILRGLVGSTVHGLGVSDGVDDRDEMGICIEPRDYVIGLSHFEQYIYRTAGEGNRSGPGDLDLCVYSLRKWMRLAANGNPTILNMLFIPEEELTVQTDLGIALRKFAPRIASRRAGQAFLGYLTQQKQRLTGERGQKNVTRPELVEKYGYDTKYAMHMLRLGVQGVEYLQTGRLTLPMPEPVRGQLRGVRTGALSLQECLTWAGELERELKDMINSSPLPREPDARDIDSFLSTTYELFWNSEKKEKV